MRNSRYWILFVACTLGWIILSLLIAPSQSGADVLFFRAPGWNLAAWRSFESAAGPYAHDLVPRFFAYYPPLAPLLFAGYAFVFPRNVYAGTIFNLLLALSAAAIVFWWVLRQPPGRLRNTAAWAVAFLAPAFVTYDRPEVVALILFSAVIAFGAKPGTRPVLAGTLIALTFLAHPFAGIVAAVWTFALCLSHQWNRPGRWVLTLKQAALVATPVIFILGATVLLYYSIDHHSLARFAANGLGASGLGVIRSLRSGREFRGVLRQIIFAFPVTGAVEYLISLLCCCLLAAWAFLHRKTLSHTEWPPIAAGLTCMLLAIFLFPYQPFYVKLVTFAIPIGLLIWSRPGDRLATPALAVLLLAVLSNVPGVGITLMARVEQRSSFEAAREQPAFLRARLASPDGVVVLNNVSSYDLFKPEFRRMVELDWLSDDSNHFADVAAVVNCYSHYHGEFGAVLPLPPQLDASQFHLIQSAPQHMWITLFGHRLTRGQWGYGCDLYVRNSAPSRTSSYQSSSHPDVYRATEYITSYRRGIRIAHLKKSATERELP